MLNKVKCLLGNEKCSRELLTREEGERSWGGGGGVSLNRVVGRPYSK